MPPFKDVEEYHENNFFAGKGRDIENNILKTFGFARFLGNLVEAYLPNMFNTFLEMSKKNNNQSKSEEGSKP